MLPTSIFFDLDDTILTFSASATYGWRVIAECYAPRLDNVTPDQLLDAIVQTRTWFWSDPDRHLRGRMDLSAARGEVVARSLQGLGIDSRDLADEMASRFTTIRTEAIRPFPGAIETIRLLGARGVLLALLTNGTAGEQRQKIERFALEPLFDLMVIEGEFGVGKPDIRVYQHALAQLRVDPTETWMVGDNLEWDVAAPQRLGMKGIWYDVAGNGLPHNTPVRPHRIIRSLTELDIE